MKKIKLVSVPKYSVGEVLKQVGSNWFREVIYIMPDYLGRKGRFGYHCYENKYDNQSEIQGFYRLCSQEHLTAWSKNKLK